MTSDLTSEPTQLIPAPKKGVTRPSGKWLEHRDAATRGVEEEAFEWGDFSMAPATEDRPVTRRLHVAFAAPDRDRVNRWWEAMRDAGHPDL